MAKPKDNPENIPIRFEGREIEPEIEKKIDELMQMEDPNPPAEAPKAEKKPVAISITEHVDEPAEPAPALESTEPVPIAAEAAVPTAPTLDEVQKAAAEQDKLLPKDQAVENPSEDEIVLPTEIKIEEPAAEPEPIVPERNEVEPEEPLDAVDELGLETAQTEQVVDDIIADEADQILEIEDRKMAEPEHAPVLAAKPKKGAKGGLRRFFYAWFHTPKYRKATFAILFLALGAATTVPSSRYFMLNSAGVRASISTTVVDQKTGQPLKNVEMAIDGKSSKSDIEGLVRVDKVRLGTHKVEIRKPGFAEISRTVTIGWGSNRQADSELKSVGLQYSFAITDFLSGKPVEDVEAISGDASALSNEKGEIILTIPKTDQEQIDVRIVGENYRIEALSLPVAQKEVTGVNVVPAKQHVFVSKRSGKFDLYKIDVDGKNEEVVLPGTGLERDDAIAVIAHPKKNITALISSRENTRNKDGFLLSTLTLVDLETKETKRIAQSERIQIIDWIGDRLVYVKIAEGESEASPNRHRLVSYDLDSETEKELASTNYFNDVIAARGAIYYTPAVYQVNGSVGLYKISPDGSNKRTIYEKEVWNLFRTSYDKISASVGQTWFELTLSNDGFTKSNGAPSALKSRVYVDSPDGKQSLWIDERDGKGVLIAYDIDTREEKTLQTQSGIKNPIQWLDADHAVYRVANGQETADYVISLSGGEPKKIKDVTNTAGIDRWYYY